jgi:hypothetical protein
MPTFDQIKSVGMFVFQGFQPSTVSVLESKIQYLMENSGTFNQMIQNWFDGKWGFDGIPVTIQSYSGPEVPFAAVPLARPSQHR